MTDALPHRGLPMRRAVLSLLAMALGLLLLGGCSTVRVTDPPRTATEQFLLSEASREAARQLETGPLRDHAVFVDGTHFAGSERDFMIGEMRAHLLLEGIRLTPTREEADIIVEVRSGGVGIDKYETLIGIPEMSVPSTDADASSAVILPEIAIVKNLRQRGYAGVSFVSYWRKTGEVLSASGPFVGRTYRTDWWFFGWGPRTRGDVPTVEPDPDE